MYIGLYEREITPPIGLDMPGYYCERLSIGVLDKLYCKAVVISESEEINEIVSPSAILGGVSSAGQEASSDFDPMNYANKIKDALEYLLPIIELSLVAIGLLIISTGNIPLGIGFMAAGAYLYSVSERSSGSFDLSVIKSDLQFLLEYIEEALIAIGVILLFLGNLPLGIGFIVAGAAIYGVKEVSSQEYSGLDIKTKIAIIMEYVSAGLAAISLISLRWEKNSFMEVKARALDDGRLDSFRNTSR
jgi:hypothetical protein